MSVIDSLLARCRHLRAIFRRDDVERELHEELDGYFGMLVEQNLARGMSARAARRAARLQFGDVDCVTEQVRDVRSGSWIDCSICSFSGGASSRSAWRWATRPSGSWSTCCGGPLGSKFLRACSLS